MTWNVLLLMEVSVLFFLKPQIYIISHSAYCNRMTDYTPSCIHCIKYNWAPTLLLLRTKSPKLYSEITDSTSDRFLSKNRKPAKNFVLLVNKVTLLTYPRLINMYCTT